jgi:hypothetical protein
MNEIPDIKKTLAPPALPPIPQLFPNLTPPDLPELSFEDATFFKRKFYKWRIKDLAKIAEYKADLAESNLRSTKAQSESFLEALTFGERYFTAIDRERTERKLNAIRVDTALAMQAQETYKAQLLGGEVKDAELTFSHKLALFKKEEEACLTE